jgi:hypothetical protein
VLVCIEQEAGNLGRLPETEWQQAGSERVETAGMPGLAGAVQSFDGLEVSPAGLSNSRMP